MGALRGETDDLARLGQFVREYHLAYSAEREDVRRSVEIAGETFLSGGSVDTDGLDEAALRITRRVQRELAIRVGVPFSEDPKPWRRWEIAKARWIALDALVYGHDNKFAKQAQTNAAAPGPPLAICVGTGFRIVDVGVRRVPFRPQGCYAVFPDADYGTGNRWPHWCDEHQASKPERDQERAFVKERKRYARQQAEWSRP